VVAALTDDRHVGQLYELTGPRLLSFEDARGGSRGGRRAGHQLRVGVHRRLVAMLKEYGLPDDFIWLLNHLFTEVLGSKAQLGDGVQRALGRQPRDFTDYAREAAATACGCLGRNLNPACPLRRHTPPRDRTGYRMPTTTTVSGTEMLDWPC